MPRKTEMEKYSKMRKSQNAIRLILVIVFLVINSSQGLGEKPQRDQFGKNMNCLFGGLRNIKWGMDPATVKNKLEHEDFRRVTICKNVKEIQEGRLECTNPDARKFVAEFYKKKLFRITAILNKDTFPNIEGQIGLLLFGLEKQCGTPETKYDSATRWKTSTWDDGETLVVLKTQEDNKKRTEKCEIIYASIKLLEERKNKTKK